MSESRRKRSPSAIGQLLPQVVRQAGQKRQQLDDLRRRWRLLVGKELAAYTQPATLRRTTLYINVDAPGASFVLSLEKPKLLAKLRRSLARRAASGAPCEIDEIVVRAGRVTCDT